MDIHHLLKETKKRGASDLHLIAGAPTALRINGALVSIDEVKLTPETTRSLVYELLSEGQKKSYK